MWRRDTCHWQVAYAFFFGRPRLRGAVVPALTLLARAGEAEGFSSMPAANEARGMCRLSVATRADSRGSTSRVKWTSVTASLASRGDRYGRCTSSVSYTHLTLPTKA